MSSLKDLSLRNFMWKQVPMANISNTDTEGHESGMTRAGSVVRSGAGWVVDGISGPRSVFTWGGVVTIYYNLHSNIM